MSQDQKIGPSPEQLLYAKILNYGMLIGLLCLLITFALYVFGIVAPYVPLDKLSHYWGTGVDSYLHDLNIPTGWAWLGMLNYGDFLNFIGIRVFSRRVNNLLCRHHPNSLKKRRQDILPLSPFLR